MLVIFDCDGVLVDSEKLAAEVFSACLRSLDIQLSAVECMATFKGHSLDYCQAFLQKKYRDFPDDFMQMLGAETEAAFSEKLKAVDGVKETLEILQRNNIPFCVASNGGHKKIKSSLETTALLPYFSQYRFSCEDVAMGKPAPDLFLFAAETMQVQARDCWVIEDSLTGVQAALAAQMHVLVYQTELSHLSLPQGVAGFTSMRVLPELLLANDH